MSKNVNQRKSKVNGCYNRSLKRLLDIFVCLIGLLLFGWLFVLLSLLVKLNMGGPVIYKSERMGCDENPFEIYKFRSMTNEMDENGVLLPGPQRLTKFGRFLRSTSMDELPSLFNIIKGDLSLVGPRPLLMKYKPYFYEHEKARHSVRPGLTGWAQVNGRNNVTWDKKFQLDLEYIEKMSLLFDIKILFLTVYKVLNRSDIIENQQETQSLYIVRSDMAKCEQKKM